VTKTVLVIGATGSTGCYLVDALHESGVEVIAAGRQNRTNKYYTDRGISYFQLDISNYDDFLSIQNVNIDCVVLLAGVMPARMKGYEPEKYISVNIKGTLNVLEFCRRSKIPKIIFAQSHSDVAGHWNTGKVIPHDAPRSLRFTGDHAVYIISKCAAVDLIEHYHQEYGLQSVYFRMPTVYCYWPNSVYYVNGFPQEMAYLGFIRKAMSSQPIEVWGDPSAAKDIVYIKDFVQMIKRAIESKTAQGFYNVGSGVSTTLDDQIKGVVDVFSPEDKKSRIIYRSDMPTQTSFFYDISKTVDDLGYSPNYSYRSMLMDMKLEMEMFKFHDIVLPNIADLTS